MSRIITPYAKKNLLRIIITVDGNGQATTTTEQPSPLAPGVILKDQAHPLLLAEIYSKLTAEAVSRIVQLQKNQGGKPNGAESQTDDPTTR